MWAVTGLAAPERRIACCTGGGAVSIFETIIKALQLVSTGQAFRADLNALHHGPATYDEQPEDEHGETSGHANRAKTTETPMQRRQTTIATGSIDASVPGRRHNKQDCRAAGLQSRKQSWFRSA